MQCPRSRCRCSSLSGHDHVVAPEISVACFERLTVPSKAFVWFEESAHEPPVEEPAKFNSLMAELVWPVAA